MRGQARRTQQQNDLGFFDDSQQQPNKLPCAITVRFARPSSPSIVRNVSDKCCSFNIQIFAAFTSPPSPSTQYRTIIQPRHVTFIGGRPSARRHQPAASQPASAVTELRHGFHVGQLISASFIVDGHVHHDEFRISPAPASAFIIFFRHQPHTAMSSCHQREMFTSRATRRLKATSRSS